MFHLTSNLYQMFITKKRVWLKGSIIFKSSSFHHNYLHRPCNISTTGFGTFVIIFISTCCKLVHFNHLRLKFTLCQCRAILENNLPTKNDDMKLTSFQFQLRVVSKTGEKPISWDRPEPCNKPIVIISKRRNIHPSTGMDKLIKIVDLL